MLTLNCYGVSCANWHLVHPHANIDMLGFLPDFVLANDPRGICEQIDERYPYGSKTWRTGKATVDVNSWAYKYPEDPPQPAVAYLIHLPSQEIAIFYPHAIVAVFRYLPAEDFDMRERSTFTIDVSTLRAQRID